MNDYMMFWLAKAVVEILITVTILAIVFGVMYFLSKK